MTPRLLVSAAGAGSAHAVIRAARRHFADDIMVIATDTNPRHLVAGVPLVDRFHQVPRVDDPSFATTMLGIVERDEIDLYVAVLDHELHAIAEWTEAGRLAHDVTTAPPRRSTEVCLDKLLAFEWLRAERITTPHTAPAAAWRWNGEPAFAKPRQGIGSIGVRRIERREELAQLDGDESMVVQAMCTPPEVTIDVFRSRDGQRSGAVCRERLETKSGVCTKARVFNDAALEAIALRVGEGLGLRGAFCLQVMRAQPSGDWAVTDINPRPGAGSPMSAAAGFDVVGAMLLDKFDPSRVDGTITPLDAECFVTRVHDEVVQHA